MAQYQRLVREKVETIIIDTFEADVMLSREITFDSEVTEYPVEDGFPVADHVTRKPMKLSMEVICTPTPVSFFDTLGVNQNRLTEVTDAVVDIYNRGEPINIITSEALYNDMVMTHAPLPRKVEDGLCLRMQLDFVHVRRVKPKTEDVPEGSTGSEAEGKSGESEKDSGAASQEDIGTGLTTQLNSDTVEIDTSFQDQANGGGFNVGKEMTAFAAMAVISSIW